ncbi:serine/threonine-protein kinase [Verrucomicrobium sp. GAS474]|uniref:serine/threonine protein kinase n=1 Tax=Verrucomicrobium sp. GAS474 TaxID=1882831 RepID=UPI0012FFAD37|nr:serine/threonine-protein kinase [Verrucomicrobium sp. GAS474]
MSVGDVRIGSDLACASCGQSFAYHPWVGRYQIEKRIGEGATGRVYLAHDSANGGAPVSIKLLNPDKARDALALWALLRESEVLTSFHHPNIVGFVEFGEIEGIRFLAIEYVPGGTLEERIRSGNRPDEKEALHIGIEAASALRQLARHGLLHRDMKPEHILIGAAGQIKITDFGLCIGIGEQDAANDVVWGTPYYIPPERLKRETEDFRSDIYSLGATLYHALAGRPPYTEGDPSKIVACHEAGPPPPIEEVAPHLHPSVAALIHRAIALDPADRFPSYEELMHAFSWTKRHLDEAPVPAQS